MVKMFLGLIAVSFWVVGSGVARADSHSILLQNSEQQNLAQIEILESGRLQVTLGWNASRSKLAPIGSPGTVAKAAQLTLAELEQLLLAPVEAKNAKALERLANDKKDFDPQEISSLKSRYESLSDNYERSTCPNTRSSIASSLREVRNALDAGTRRAERITAAEKETSQGYRAARADCLATLKELLECAQVADKPLAADSEEASKLKTWLTNALKDLEAEPDCSPFKTVERAQGVLEHADRLE